MREPALAPSARILDQMLRSYQGSYTDFTCELSRQHRATMMQMPLPKAEEERFARLATASIAKQKQIEAGDTLPFEEYRKKYLAVERLGFDRGEKQHAHHDR
jgi:glutamate--cysteine ligase